MAEKHTCEVAVFNLHSSSRLPRPMLVRKRKCTSPVCHQTLLHDAPCCTSHLKFPALKSTLNDQPSRIPMPCQILNQLNHDEFLTRPQTSASAYARRKPSGRSNLLHKIQAISIHTDSSEEDSCFTRLQPLPAIGCPTSESEESLLHMEEFNQKQNLINEEERLKTAESCTLSSSFPLETDSRCALASLSDLERTQSPSLTNFSDISTKNIAESEMWEEKTDANAENQNSGSETFCTPLFEKMDRDSIQHFYEVDNVLAERPKTSCPLFTHSEDEQFPSRPLIRSNTYDILPTVHEEESSETKIMATGDVNSSSEMNDTEDSHSTDSASLEENFPHRILLAIQTSPGNYIYGYFHTDNSLQAILDFASEMRGCNYEDYKLKMGDASQHQLKDLQQTITQAKLKHRTVLQIYKDDNE